MKKNRCLPLGKTMLAIAALSSALPAFADECSPIRLDEAIDYTTGKVLSFGQKPKKDTDQIVAGSMFHVAVRNQRSVGSCYAHTSAQMYDAWRFRHGDQDVEDYENFSSGYEIGQRFKINGNDRLEKNSRLFKLIDLDKFRGKRIDTNINGGFVKRLLPFLLQEGTCSQLELSGLFEDKEKLDVDQYASAILGKVNTYRTNFHEAEGKINAKYFPELITDPLVNSKDDFRYQSLQPALMDNTRAVNRTAQAYIAMDAAKRRAAADKEIDIARAGFVKRAIADLKSYHRLVLKNKSQWIDYDALLVEGLKWSPDYVNTVKMFEILSVAVCPDGHRMKARGHFEVENHNSYFYWYNIGGKKIAIDEPEPTDGQPRPDKLYSRYRPDVLDTVVNEELDKGLERAYPIAIGYCSAIFKAGRGYTERKYDGAKDECGRHASMIIGRRPNPKDKNSCQYLIRNSWGNGCGGAYHKDWDCEASAGSVWVDAATLNRAVHDLQTIRPIADK